MLYIIISLTNKHGESFYVSLIICFFYILNCICDAIIKILREISIEEAEANEKRADERHICFNCDYCIYYFRSLHQFQTVDCGRT